MTCKLRGISRSVMTTTASDIDIVATCLQVGGYIESVQVRDAITGGSSSFAERTNYRKALPAGSYAVTSSNRQNSHIGWVVQERKADRASSVVAMTVAIHPFRNLSEWTARKRYDKRKRVGLTLFLECLRDGRYRRIGVGRIWDDQYLRRVTDNVPSELCLI